MQQVPGTSYFLCQFIVMDMPEYPAEHLFKRHFRIDVQRADPLPGPEQERIAGPGEDVLVEAGIQLGQAFGIVRGGGIEHARDEAIQYVQVVIGEVIGSVSEGGLLSAVFEGRAQLTDAISQHMEPKLDLIGSHEDLSVCVKQLSETDAVMVVEDGKPCGVLTRHDLLGVHV